MENIKNIIFIIAIVLIILISLFLVFIIISNNIAGITSPEDPISATIIVLKADEERNCLKVLGIAKYGPEATKSVSYDIFEVDLTYSDTEASKFKLGQEIEYKVNTEICIVTPNCVYASKVKVTKEKTDIFIPKEFIRYCYSSVDKVNVTVNEITPNSITLTVTDTNEYPYYNISKPFFGIERLEDSSYKSLTRKSYAFSSTIEPLVYNIPNMTEDDKYTVTGWKIDWTEEYGTLEEGNYQIYLPEPVELGYGLPKRVEIKINFSVNAKGEVTYEEPVIE